MTARAPSFFDAEGATVGYGQTFRIKFDQPITRIAFDVGMVRVDSVGFGGLWGVRQSGGHFHSGTRLPCVARNRMWGFFSIRAIYHIMSRGGRPEDIWTLKEKQIWPII
jgi:hypothetical protein